MTQGTVGGRRVRHITRTLGLMAPGRRRWGPGLVVAWLLWLSWAGIAHGAPGDLDPTFGAGGVATSFGPMDNVGAMVVQSDGKLVVAGTSVSPIGGVNFILLVRYLPDGRVDGSFGPGGKVITSVGSGSGANALIQQPDGQLVVAGSSSPVTGGSSDVLLVRYHSDGQLDPTFGVGGVVTTDFGANERATALIQQPDGQLVVAGSSIPVTGGSITLIDVLLVRYHSDGQLDPTFGVGGVVTADFGAMEWVTALIQQPDGQLVVAGASGFFRFENTILARYHPDGRLDESFGVGGKVSVLSGRSINVAALLLQADGKLVVTGSRSDFGLGNLLVTRFQAHGTLDPTFGQAGAVIFSEGSGLSAPTSAGRAVIQQPDGKLVVAGFHSVDTSSAHLNMLLVRFLPDGDLDPAFGVGGLVITDVGGTEGASALVQQPDGTLVVAGSLGAGNESAILLARYQALGCPAADPDPCLASLAAFVTEVYQAAFARQPDAGEVDDWVEVLATEPTLDTVREMLHAVFDGPEFRQRPVNPWHYVEALYRAMLGREPASAEIDLGVQAVLDRVNTLLPGLVDSPEFQSLVPRCQDQAAVTRLVERLYQYALGRGGNPAGWTQAIITWCAVEEGVEDFLNSLEYLAVPRTLADHVTVLYRALLAREPDAGGLAEGVKYLAGQLADFEDDIMASPEFEAHVYALFP